MLLGQYVPYCRNSKWLKEIKFEDKEEVISVVQCS